MPYLLLAAAIALEVMATINLRLSDGFTRLVRSILVVIGYLGAFGLLSQVLKAGVPVARPLRGHRSARSTTHGTESRLDVDPAHRGRTTASRARS